MIAFIHVQSAYLHIKTDLTEPVIIVPVPPAHAETPVPIPVGAGPTGQRHCVVLSGCAWPRPQTPGRS